MNTFAVLFLCVQACLVQNVFGQGLGKSGPAAAIAPGLGPAVAPGFGYPGSASGYPAGPYGVESYGGAGEGNVAVGGELSVAGTTAVNGQVPIMGAVTFGGNVPASGVVSITGNCACACGGPYMY